MERLDEPMLDDFELTRRMYEIAEGNLSRPNPEPDPIGIADIMRDPNINSGIMDLPDISPLPGHTPLTPGHASFFDY